MKVFPAMRRYGPAIAITCAGTVFFRLSGEASCLLAAIVAIWIYAGGSPSRLSIVISTLAFGLFLLLPGPDIPAEAKTFLRMAAFLASALVIGLLIRGHQREASSDRAEHQGRLIVESMPGLGWSTDPEGRFNYVNPSVLKYTGKSVRQIDRIGTSETFGWEQVVHPQDVDHTATAWLDSLRNGDEYRSEFRIRRYDGAYRWFQAVARPSRDESGSVTGWYGTSIDIDDQKKAEDALRASAQQLRLLVDTIPTLVWCATPEGEPSYINKRLMDHVGLTLEDLDTPGGTRLATAIQSVVHPDDTPTLQRVLGHSFASGEPFNLQYRMRRADGVYRWVSGRADALRDVDGHIVQWYGVCIDIEDERRMQDALSASQDRLARASQAASLAELSASIAHEVNQPLAALVSNSHACQRWLSAEPPNIERARITAERIIRDSNSAAEVVSRIRALFKQGALARISVNINEVIAEVRQMMTGEVAMKDIHLETDLADGLPSVLVDRVQIQQVLVNLVRNGVDAMDSVVGGPRSLTIGSRRGGDGAVLVEVRDHGSGVEDPDRIFETFFTTKERGMGMGLAICRSIVEAHNGRLWATKNEPRGAALVFTLPVAASDPA